MSYDLYFWREEPGTEIDVERFLDDLDDTVGYPGIVSLPLDLVKQAFRQQFPAFCTSKDSMPAVMERLRIGSS